MNIQPILDLIKARGSLAKQEIIRANKDDKDFLAYLKYALTDTFSYNVAEASISRGYSLVTNEIERLGLDEYDKSVKIRFSTIFEWCEYLNSLSGVNDQTLCELAYFLWYANKFTVSEICLWVDLLCKTVPLGVTAVTVNKVVPKLIPKWDVQQSFPLEHYPLKEGTEFWLTQKLNGVRATFYRGNFYARSGKRIEGLELIENELKQLKVTSAIDGELTLIRTGKYANVSDNEAFRIATGIINSTDSIEKSFIQFTVFDMIPLPDFETTTPTSTYAERRKHMDKQAVWMKEQGGFEHVSILPVLYHGTDQSKIDELLDKMVAEDKEGLMVNLDVPYYKRRHRGILKVKRFYTMDLPIIRCEEGEGRLVGTLGAFVVDFDGAEVSVGSGFSDAQRSEYWSKRDEMVGTLCEVKYKEISTNKKTGTRSLQFPIFVRLRTDKTEVSYG